MNPSKPAHRANEAEKGIKPAASRSRFDAYPLLGLLLAIVLAVLVYGGLFLLLS